MRCAKQSDRYDEIVLICCSINHSSMNPGTRTKKFCIVTEILLFIIDPQHLSDTRYKLNANENEIGLEFV